MCGKCDNRLGEEGNGSKYVKMEEKEEGKVLEKMGRDIIRRKVERRKYLCGECINGLTD